MRKKKLATGLILVTALGLAGCTAVTDESTTNLTIESYRTEDAALWNNEIIPLFEKEHPEISVEFTPTKNTEFNAALESRLAGGTAGDLIMCRAFDISLALYDKGYFEPLTDQAGLENFSDLNLSAWRGADDTQYCLPMASVIHGFYYNKAIFAELGLSEPKTVDEFMNVLETIEAAGDVDPLAWGTGDTWTAYETAYSNIGPTYWKGEEGRQGLLDGTKKFTDPEFVEAWEALDAWQPYFPDGYESVRYTDTQQLFTLGRAAIYPGGSWEITGFEAAPFEIGIFAPPVVNEGDQCYISDHTDHGLGINSDSPNKEAAAVFLEWLAGTEFASAYANVLPGFFPLTTEEINVENEIAQEFLSFREDCDETVRLVVEELSAGEPNTGNSLGLYTAELWNGNLTPNEVATEVQSGLDSWFYNR